VDVVATTFVEALFLFSHPSPIQWSIQMVRIRVVIRVCIQKTYIQSIDPVQRAIELLSRSACRC
jgi:hypothetical protein